MAQVLLFQVDTLGPASIHDLLGSIGLSFAGFGMAPQGMGGSMEEWMDRLFQQHQASGPPPASQEYVHKLPINPVLQKDVDANLECAVCKDTFELGQECLELPCNHSYHPSCIHPWLKDHNTCPLCRYELPTTDEEYEKGRKERMAQRNVDDDVEANALAADILNGRDVWREDMIQQVEGWVRNPPSQPVEDPMDIESPTGPQVCEMREVRREDCILLEDPEEAAHVSLSCGHNFHSECLQGFLHIASQAPDGVFRCPRCRENTSILAMPEVD